MVRLPIRYTPGMVELALEAHAALAEGPRWDARIERLIWVDIDGKALHRLRSRHRRGRSHADAGQGRLPRFPPPTRTACSSRSPTGSRSPTSAAASSSRLLESRTPTPALRANDGAIDPAGRLWIGTMADDESPGKGALYPGSTVATAPARVGQWRAGTAW